MHIIDIQLQGLASRVPTHLSNGLHWSRWDVSASAIDTRAEAYGWPVTMVEVLEHATQKASLEYTQLQRKLKVDTQRLQADIEKCSKQVSIFAALNDVNEQVEYAAQGQALWKQLEAAMEQAAYINSEEHLFDLHKSEWPRIAQLQKELQPYLDLWVRFGKQSHATGVAQLQNLASAVQLLPLHVNG
jgi:hypothetical protein